MHAHFTLAGAEFGCGIYFSSELPVAYAFCQKADRGSWRQSALGQHTVRCLLVCSIEKEHIQDAHNNALVRVMKLGVLSCAKATAADATSCAVLCAAVAVGFGCPALLSTAKLH